MRRIVLLLLAYFSCGLASGLSAPNADEVVSISWTWGPFVEWVTEPNNLTAIGTVAAVAISMIAFAHTRLSASSQELKQKREEFRKLLGQLVDYRIELNNAMNSIHDEQGRVSFSSIVNGKRLVVLTAAETLAEEIKGVSVAEYLVLGNENQADFDFSDARKFFSQGVRGKESTRQPCRRLRLWCFGS